MDFRHLAVAALFCLAFAGRSHAHGQDSTPDEDYWQALWPNTQIPSVLRELLQPGAADAEISDLPMKIDDTQNPKTFFFEHDLYPGKTMKLQFSKRPWQNDLYTWGPLANAKNLETEGFTYKEVCVNNPNAKGEHKFCAKSLGTLIGFAISKLGKNVQALSSSFVGMQNQYTVKGVQNLGDKAVMCHRLNFQRIVFYCHEINQTTAFLVSLMAADGTKTQALAVCHYDTSAMNAEILYEVLKIKPGTATACHFLGNKAVMWVPNLVENQAYNSNVGS